MAITPDKIAEIQNYQPAEARSIYETVHLGPVDNDLVLTYRMQRVQMRALHLPNEPKLPGETYLPGLDLSIKGSNGRVRKPLVYRSDIEALREDIASRVWLAVVTSELVKH